MLKVAENRNQRNASAQTIKSFSDLASAGQQVFTPTRFLPEGVVTLTAHEAGLLLNDTRYDRQVRDLTAAGADHIAVLADIMSMGKWRRKEKLDFARLPSGLLTLVNGHHRLSAQAQAGVAIEWMIVIHDCRDEEAISDLYKTFDTNVRMRGVGTLLDVSGIAEKIGIKKTTAADLYRAVPLIEMGFVFSNKNRSPVIHRVIDRRFERMESFQKEIIAWEAAVEPAPAKVRKRLGTQGALAVALMTFRHQPELAAEFWGGVARNDGLRRGDPRHSYLNVLNEDAGKKDGSAVSTAGYAAAGWNAFFDRRKGAFIKLHDGPIRIAGTPIGRK